MARQDDWLDTLEQVLIEGYRLHLRQRDPEVGFLRSGSAGTWPQVIREWWEYPGDDEPRAPGLGRREMKLVDALFNDQGCLLEPLLASDMKLMGVALRLKAFPEKGGFAWQAVWKALPREMRRTETVERLRSRFDTLLARLAVQGAARGLWPDAAAFYGRQAAFGEADRA